MRRTNRGANIKMNETKQNNIHKEAMVWVNEIAKNWIQEGLDLEQIFNRAWLRYGLVAYRVNNTAKKG